MNAPLLSHLRLMLPTACGELRGLVLSEPRQYPRASAGAFNRIAFSAAHVVADARADNDPWSTCDLDWDKTLAFREHLWALGLGVAEAMDTAQRGMGLDWPRSRELIERSIAAGKSWSAREGRPALIASGCGTDHLNPAPVRSIDEVIRAYEDQMHAVEAAGGRLILMASRALARAAQSPSDYERVYDRLIGQAREPVIIHWLGDMFDPALAGYWGDADPKRAMVTALAIINANAAKVDGVKISLLDKDMEIAMRRRLAKGVWHSRPHLAAVAPHLRGASALLQDGRRLHGLPDRPARPLHHGRRAAKRALARPSGRALPPRRPRRPAGRSGTLHRRMRGVLALHGVT